MDPTEKDVNLYIPSHDPLIFKLSSKMVQKEAVNQLMLFIILANPI
jgi:hypothetical protein